MQSVSVLQSASKPRQRVVASSYIAAAGEARPRHELHVRMQLVGNKTCRCKININYFADSFNELCSICNPQLKYENMNFGTHRESFLPQQKKMLIE